MNEEKTQESAGIWTRAPSFLSVERSSVYTTDEGIHFFVNLSRYLVLKYNFSST